VQTHSTIQSEDIEEFRKTLEELTACQSGMSIYFTNMEDLILKLKKDHEAGKPGKSRSYYKSALVVVDEVGYTPITALFWKKFWKRQDLHTQKSNNERLS
jgi:hypothetical protein